MAVQNMQDTAVQWQPYRVAAWGWLRLEASTMTDSRAMRQQQ